MASLGGIELFTATVAAREHLERGTLAAVLPDCPSTLWPIHALYPKNRHLLPKVSVFLDFLSDLFGSRRRPSRSR
jgi:DNA-binding transcriptional LysR family regulator